MDTLTDAEYSRLTTVEKAQYWANRYQDLEVRFENLQRENKILRQTLVTIHDASNGHNYFRG